jgi:misacylated tRNA(Ala) deacylase
MANALYMDDMFLKECTAKVESVKDGKYIVLDQTVFYPNSGGVECDTGVITRQSDNAKFNVVFVGKFSGEISHEVDNIGLAAGDKVHCSLNWDRRQRLMRYHTAAHVLSGVFSKDTNAKITGNQITTEKGRIDFDLDNFDRELIDKCFAKANEIVQHDYPIVVYYKPREEALRDPNMVKLANAMPPEVTNLRVVDIKGFDYQADGGCHVKSTREIGKITFTKADNKGKSNRRVYFTIG